MEKALHRIARAAITALAIGICLLDLAAVGRATDRGKPKSVAQELVKDPVHMQPFIGFCQYAGRDIPCTKLTITFEDGTEDGGRVLAMCTDGKDCWRRVTDALGIEMDKVQILHHSLKKEGK